MAAVGTVPPSPIDLEGQALAASIDQLVDPIDSDHRTARELDWAAIHGRQHSPSQHDLKSRARAGLRSVTHRHRESVVLHDALDEGTPNDAARQNAAIAFDPRAFERVMPMRENHGNEGHLAVLAGRARKACPIVASGSFDLAR